MTVVNDVRTLCETRDGEFLETVAKLDRLFELRACKKDGAKKRQAA